MLCYKEKTRLIDGQAVVETGEIVRFDAFGEAASSGRHAVEKELTCQGSIMQ